MPHSERRATKGKISEGRAPSPSRSVPSKSVAINLIIQNYYRGIVFSLAGERNVAAFPHMRGSTHAAVEYVATKCAVVKYAVVEYVATKCAVTKYAVTKYAVVEYVAAKCAVTE